MSDLHLDLITLTLDIVLDDTYELRGVVTTANVVLFFDGKSMACVLLVDARLSISSTTNSRQNGQARRRPMHKDEN